MCPFIEKWYMPHFPGEWATLTYLGRSWTKAKGSVGQDRQRKGTSPLPKAASVAPHSGSPLALAGKGTLSQLPDGSAQFEGSKHVLKERATTGICWTASQNNEREVSD